ncbi:hypothetical protein GQ600_3442 [Phytophthora cactorum]|nr:hypothetical protein GQ600_3442 [Phytophthora cactorum]
MSTASATLQTQSFSKMRPSKVAEDVGESPTILSSVCSILRKPRDPHEIAALFQQELIESKEAGAKLEDDLLICGECVVEKERKERKERDVALERERAAAKATLKRRQFLRRPERWRKTERQPNCSDPKISTKSIRKTEMGGTGEGAEQVRHHLHAQTTSRQSVERSAVLVRRVTVRAAIQ